MFAVAGTATLTTERALLEFPLMWVPVTRAARTRRAAKDPHPVLLLVLISEFAVEGDLSVTLLAVQFGVHSV